MMLAAASTISSRAVVQRVTPKAPVRRSPIRPHALFGGGDNKEGGGGLGGLGNMANIMENMKKAQSLVQTEAAKVQEELSQTEFDGYDEEETVKVVFLGNQSPVKCELTQAAMECGQEELEKRIQEAMADAHAKSVTGMREKMSELAKKLGLPENMNFGQ